jgi:site-specific DNA-cytosine methylase
MSTGIGMSAQAAYNAIGESNMRFVFGAEIHEGVREAARAGWAGEMQSIFLTKHMESDVEEMVALGKIDILDVSDSCAPVSHQSRLGVESERRRGKIEESLDVMYATLRYAARARPRAIVIENVDWSERFSGIEAQLHATLQAADYEVCMQVGGPEDVGARVSRKRLWILAVVREIGLGRLDDIGCAEMRDADGSDGCER